jgi:purine-binding chemotaxis protein CheW
MTSTTTERPIAASPVPASAPNPRAGKYLTFALGKEEFGIQVLRVKEIMGVQDITAVPGTPAHLKGVINLRGKIIPVVDLRVKFNLPQAPFTQTTCIIVVQVQQERVQQEKASPESYSAEAAPQDMRVGETMIGVIVDGVSEVLNLNGGEIEDPPDFGEGVDTPFVLGIAKCRTGVKILLKIEDILTFQELRGIEALIQ